MITFLKVLFLLMFVVYSVPVLIGGLKGAKVSGGQAVLWAIGLTGFVSLQWVL